MGKQPSYKNRLVKKLTVDDNITAKIMWYPKLGSIVCRPCETAEAEIQILRHTNKEEKMKKSKECYNSAVEKKLL